MYYLYAVVPYHVNHVQLYDYLTLVLLGFGLGAYRLLRVCFLGVFFCICVSMIALLCPKLIVVPL